MRILQFFNYTKDPILLTVLRIVGVGVFVVLSLLAAALVISWQPFEIMVSFLPQIMIVLSGVYCLLFALLAKFIIRDGFRLSNMSIRRRDAAVLMGGLVLLTFIVQQAFFGPIRTISAQESFGDEIRVATFNKFYLNNSTKGLTLLAGQAPDILALQEADEASIAMFQERLNLPYKVQTDCDCSAGNSEVAVLSRYPVSDSLIIAPHQNGAVVKAVVEHPTIGSISVYGVHITPPLSQFWHDKRIEMLDEATKVIESDSNPVFVMGDFNTTIYSRDLRNFVADTQSQTTLVLDYNWPKCSRYEDRIPTDIACLRIDHIFIPSSVDYTGSLISNQSDSDHLPFIANVVFPAR